MDQAKVGAFIRQLRKEQGLTQEQLGRRLGVTNKTVSRWECGNYLPDLDTCLLLSDTLGITVNELLLGQRLSDAALRTTANRVLSDAVHTRAFSLAERTKFWKRKWLGEHRGLLVAAATLWIALFVLLLCWEQGRGLPRAAAGAGMAVLGLCMYAHLHNRMMIYVENKRYGDLPAGSEQNRR